MKNKIFIFSLFAVLGVVLYLFSPNFSIAACTDDSGCGTKCAGGLVYKYKCSNGNCVNDLTTYWCENDCCNNFCQRDYGATGYCSSNSSCACGIVPSTYCSGNAVCIENPLQADTLEEIVDNIINFVFKIAIIVVPIMATIAGFMFVTSGGNPEKYNKARDLLIWTAIGLAVVLLSKGASSIINQILGG